MMSDNLLSNQSLVAIRTPEGSRSTDMIKVRLVGLALGQETSFLTSFTSFICKTSPQGLGPCGRYNATIAVRWGYAYRYSQDVRPALNTRGLANAFS